MVRKTLPTALELIFGDEGAYSSAPTDRGNYLNGVLVGTKYGITGATPAAHRGVRTVTAAQVIGMSLREAEDIYRRSYWPQSGGDVLPPGLDYFVFNNGVMPGPMRAVKILQSVVGVREDSHIGEQTLAAVRRYPGIRAYSDAYTLCRLYVCLRLRFRSNRGCGPVRALYRGPTTLPPTRYAFRVALRPRPYLWHSSSTAREKGAEGRYDRDAVSG
ncbi:MAG: glycosyl hydrolase 108 family protein [Shinella sp.]|uniref:glycosyl hydrolase 108 family protein n=1 Tax=Shinella sp. TaxID=1870904 RepID=UPI003C717368